MRTQWIWITLCAALFMSGCATVDSVSNAGVDRAVTHGFFGHAAAGSCHPNAAGNGC